MEKEERRVIRPHVMQHGAEVSLPGEPDPSPTYDVVDVDGHIYAEGFRSRQEASDLVEHLRKDMAIGSDTAGGFLVRATSPPVMGVTPRVLLGLREEELFTLHNRLHKLWEEIGDKESAETSEGRLTKEDVANAHAFLEDEMRRRDLSLPEKDPIRDAIRALKAADELAKAVEAFRESVAGLKTASKAQGWLAGRLADGRDAVLVPAYVSAVGSAAEGDDREIRDLDLLVRDELGSMGQGWRESIWLLARKLLDPAKAGLQLHLLGNPQGPHLAEGQAYIPIFDLVLRPRKEVERVTKVDEPNAHDDQYDDECKWILVSGIGPVCMTRRRLAEMLDVPVEKIVRQRDGKWCLLTRDGSRTLGCHDTKEDAMAQERAVQANKRTVKPIQRYQPQKPSGSFFTDFKDVEELWSEWASKKDVTYLVSPKVDGFRTTLQKEGDRVSIYFEDSKEERSGELPTIAAAMKKLDKDAMLEGELVVRSGGKYLARPQIASFLAGKVDGTPELFLYDVLYWGDDVHEQAFDARLPMLRAAANQSGLRVLPQRKVDGKEALDAAARSMSRWGPDDMPVEGVVVRDASMPYSFGSTNDYAKVKKFVEIKARVVKPIKVENGWVYEIGLFSDSHDKVIPLGRTFVSQDKLADEGDTLNVQVEEILLHPDKTISTGKPRPLSVDRSRGPYTVEQVVGLARRFGALKEMSEIGKIGEEGGTRSAAARRFWRDNWHESFPESGKGRFVYHHHWRGLDEEQAKLGEDALLDTDHSVHGDLRFSLGDALFGFTVFLGSTADNRKAGGDRLATLKQDDALQGSFKLQQPKEWLAVGRDKPLEVEPGGVGSTAEGWSKFFAVDSGTYETGVWKQNFVELFLDGSKLKGRFLMQNVPFGGRARTWTITRPDDQTPFAESHELEDEVKDQRSKGRDFIVWGKPGQRPEKIDVKTWEPPKEEAKKRDDGCRWTSIGGRPMCIHLNRG